MSGPGEALGPLDRAQAALSDSDATLARLGGERNAALLRDDDVEAVRLDGEIEAQERLRRVQADKVTLLEREAERLAAEKRAAAQAETIAGVEMLFAERDRIGAELAGNIEAADRAFVRMLELGREIRAAWTFSAHDLAPMLVAESTVLQALVNEFYRIGGRPAPGGGQVSPYSAPSFPGGRPERIEFANLPGKIQPLVEKLAAASGLASRVMREGFSTNQLAPAAPAAINNGDGGPTATAGELPQISPFKAEPNPELSKLLARANELARMPQSDEVEAEYQRIGEQVRALS